MWLGIRKAVNHSEQLRLPSKEENDITTQDSPHFNEGVQHCDIPASDILTEHTVICNTQRRDFLKNRATNDRKIYSPNGPIHSEYEGHRRRQLRKDRAERKSVFAPLKKGGGDCCLEMKFPL